MDINKLLVLNFLKNYSANIPCKSGEFYISITAGEVLYSRPAEKMENPDYKMFEIAIFTKDGIEATDEQKSILNPILGKPRDVIYGWVTQEEIWACVNAL